MSDDALTELATEWEKMGVILRKTAERTISDSDIAAAEAYETCAKYLREVLAAACPPKALGWSDAFDVAQRGSMRGPQKTTIESGSS